MYIWRKRVTANWLSERNDALVGRFGAALAIVEQPGKRQITLQVSCPTAGQVRSLVREFGGKADKLPRNWLKDFARRAQTKPLRIGSRLIVRSTPDPKRGATSARTLVIPAEAAFGTGEHATTAMCLRLLERQTRRHPRGWSMLDAGTGSGILALAARSLRAGRVLAIDNDPLACAVAKRNARANRARGIKFETGDVLKLAPKETFDVITANLFSELLIAALPGWSRQLRPDGFLILSGILRTQEKAVAAALRKNGFALREVRRRGKWVALLAEHRTAQRPVSSRKNS